MINHDQFSEPRASDDEWTKEPNKYRSGKAPKDQRVIGGYNAVPEKMDM